MKNRTVVIILSVSLMLFLYIFFVDGRFMSTDEKKSRAENVFATLRAERVDTIELETSKGKVTLKATEASPGAETGWRISAPKSLKADDTEVQALISAMDFLIYNRTVEDNRSDKRFGLTAPRIKGTAWFGDHSVSFAVGADAPDGDGVYMSVDFDHERFFVVSTDFLSAMNKGVNDLRDRHLLQIDTAQVAGLSLHSDSQDWEAIRNDDTGDWQITYAGKHILGAVSELKQLVTMAAELKISQFVADSTTDLQKYGFAPATSALSLITSDNRHTTIELGTSCGEGRVYARVGEQPAVHCVGTQFQSLLTRPVSRYFEKRLLPISPDDTTRIRITKGQEIMELSKDEDLWHVSGLETEETSQTAFSELFDELKKRHATTIRFAPNTGTDQITNSSDTDTDGTVVADGSAIPAGNEAPLLTAEVETADAQMLSLLFYADPSTPNGVLLKRSNTDGWLPFPSDVIRVLDPYPVRFRKKMITQCHPDDIVSIDITSNGIRQMLKKSHDEWLIDVPAAAASDAASIKKLLSLACETPVTAYPRATEDPFTREKLFATVSVSFTEHTHDGKTQDNTQTGKATIEIGARSDSGTRFARVSSRPNLIFTVADDYTSFLSRPLAARNLLSIESGIINRVMFKNTALSFEAQKENGVWHSDNCVLDSDAMERIVIDFGAVKAIESHSFSKSIPNPTAEIQFSSKEADTPAILKFGDIVPENDGIVAAREGLGISYVLPARLIRDMAGVCRTE